MPVELVFKRKTEPMDVYSQKALVPLRVTGFKDGFKDHGDCSVEVGHIIVSIPGWFSGQRIIFNATNAQILNQTFVEKVLTVRAYDVAQIILTNDGEPAPVI